MNYNEDTIDWQAVALIDDWLDSDVSQVYKDQPLAQDWARLCKASEEIGEAISELILFTGQNPRKRQDPDAGDRMLAEAAQTAITGILAIQHFTKNTAETREIIRETLRILEMRVPV